MYRPYVSRMSSALGPPQQALPGVAPTYTVPAERVTNPESVRIASVSASVFTPVQTHSATELAQRAATAVVDAATDPYNPATRFAQYFPPAPLPYVCPERLPSKEPAPSSVPCAPVTRHVGSSTSEPDGGAI